MVSHKDYIRVLERWVKSAINDIHSVKDRSTLKFYGTGTNGWGVQTHQKGFSALAVLATDPYADSRRMGISKEELLEISIMLLRYNLESHKEGSYHCTDGENVKWGHTWISALGIERMMHGVEAIFDYLTNDDKELLRKVILSEADWLLINKPVNANEIHPNEPESNMWNGATLLRAALMYPDAPNVEKYKEKGNRFLLNAISIPSDKDSNRIYFGKPLKDWHSGANFFESYSLNHHGYLNVGYMIITLSNIAMLHFTYRKYRQMAPASLYHNMEYLWRLVRAFIYEDGRLFRIGGDTRVRYCYCQDYLVPVLLLVKDCLNEDCDELEKRWLEIVKKEMDYNDDNTFLSKRCELLVEKSPLYFTRLESDRACTISLGAYWRREYNEIEERYGTSDYDINEEYKKELSAWSDEYHGAEFVKDENRYASFVWRSAEGPQGHCLPTNDSSLAEWQYNMTSRVEGGGLVNTNQIVSFNNESFNGGFVTSGVYHTITSQLLEEQDDRNTNVANKIAFAALPDGHTTMTLQYAYTLRRCHLNAVKGFHLNIPNDVFNDFKREYYYKDGVLKFEHEGVEESLSSVGRWVNVDNKLGIVLGYGEDLKLYHPNYRKVGLRHSFYKERGFLLCDEICTSFDLKPQWFDKGEKVFDFGIVVMASIDYKTTSKINPFVVYSDNDKIRTLGVEAIDGNCYLLVLNVSDNIVSCNLSFDNLNYNTVEDLLTKKELEILNNDMLITVEGNGSKLFRVK